MRISFCAENSIQSEVAAFIDFLHEVYADFGFSDIIYKLSTRPEERVGSDESWDKAEKALADALDTAGLDWEELPGEGAFYGPKIEFSLRDCLDRVWQCGTIQVDFSMPGRLGAQFVNEHGDRRNAGDAAPCHPRFLRALHRYSDRALCRCAAGLAVAAAGGGDEYYPTIRRIIAVNWRKNSKKRVFEPLRT